MLNRLNQWRGLATRYENTATVFRAGLYEWRTAYERHRRWSADGTWDKHFEAVLANADAEGRIDWSTVMVGVDSTSCRAHQHVAGARKSARGCQRRTHARQHRPDEGLGHSRGGLTCKIPPRRGRRMPPAGPAADAGRAGRRPRSYPSWNAFVLVGSAAGPPQDTRPSRGKTHRVPR
jgi:transposase